MYITVIELILETDVPAWDQYSSLSKYCSDGQGTELGLQHLQNDNPMMQHDQTVVSNNFYPGSLEKRRWYVFLLHNTFNFLHGIWHEPH